MRVSRKGQVTIPIEIRERLGLLPHTEVRFEVEDNAVRIVRETPDLFVPDELRRDLLAAVGRYVAGALEDKGVSEEEILDDFSDFRRHRC